IGGERAGGIALLRQHFANVVVADRKAALPLGIVGFFLRKCLDDRKAVAIGCERFGETALFPQRFANPGVAQRQLGLVIGIVWERGEQRLENAPRLGCVGECALGVTNRPQSVGGLYQGRCLAAAQSGGGFAATGELVL